MLRKLAAVIAPLMLAAAIGGTAFAFGSPTGGAGGSGGGGTTTASGTANFFDGTVNGVSDCDGVGGQVGGSFGSAHWIASTPSTVTIHLNHAAPNASFTVIVDQPPSCTEYTLGTLTTDRHGNGSGTFTFSGTFTGTGTFVLFPRTDGAHEYQTHVITF
jgi:hypothetical protein